LALLDVHGGQEFGEKKFPGKAREPTTQQDIESLKDMMKRQYGSTTSSAIFHTSSKKKEMMSGHYTPLPYSNCMIWLKGTDSNLLKHMPSASSQPQLFLLAKYSHGTKQRSDKSQKNAVQL
jgi:hypothetical protein